MLGFLTCRVISSMAMLNQKVSEVAVVKTPLAAEYSGGTERTAL